jgi:hypothetical protein
VQPAQLSLMPEQVPAPPVAVAEQLPEAEVAAALLLLSRLIAQMPTRPATRSGEVSGGE